jgi:Tol biopolymer transport system component
MMRFALSFGTAVALFISVACQAQQGSVDKFDTLDLSGPFLGLEPPGVKPALFAPGIISSGFDEHEISFSPDGTELFLAMPNPAHSQFFIIHMKQREGGQWTKPEVATFSGNYYDRGPQFSPDGNRVYFNSMRPKSGMGEPGDFDIWYVEKTERGWSEAMNLGPPVNTQNGESYPSFTNDGTMYYCVTPGSSFGPADIYRARPVNGGFAEPERIGYPLNGDTDDFYPVVAPDESYLVFVSNDRAGSFGGNDLYISFQQKSGAWSEPVNMGEEFNTKGWENSPKISSDGRYFFFITHNQAPPQWPAERLSYEELIVNWQSPETGSFDIYWVEARILEQFRKQSGE